MQKNVDGGKANLVGCRMALRTGEICEYMYVAENGKPDFPPSQLPPGNNCEALRLTVLQAASHSPLPRIKYLASPLLVFLPYCSL